VKAYQSGLLALGYEVNRPGRGVERNRISHRPPP
jgi:hypothetical protein